MAVEWVVFHVTDRCQLNCKHCLRDPEKSAHDIEPALVARVLDEAVQNYGCHHVGLTGGEPTLHPEFLGIVDAIVDRGLTWHVIQKFQEEKLAALEAGQLEAWDYFPCNYCMKYFGKPHWTDEGPAGAVAERARWRGAWAPERHVGTAIPISNRLRVLADGA